MQYLLDTHCLIWFQEANPKIPARVMEVLQNTSNNIFFSQLSLFEVTIKQKIGKLPDFKATIDEVYAQAVKDNFAFLPVKNSHIEAYDEIPLLAEHRDPFDRLLIATAKTEDLVIVTADKNFGLYKAFLAVMW